ncbi:hypothetical protein GCM10020229_41400 [Kitasatospora albolonga]
MWDRPETVAAAVLDAPQVRRPGCEYGGALGRGDRGQLPWYVRSVQSAGAGTEGPRALVDASIPARIPATARKRHYSPTRRRTFSSSVEVTSPQATTDESRKAKRRQNRNRVE